MIHRKWEPGSLYAQAMRDIANEHNATVDALKEAQTRYMDVIAENNRLDRELDGARQALKQPIRVPFSDEQIEKMAAAFYEARWGHGEWDSEGESIKDMNRSAIRAAVAAGGLEPCPVPEYDPEDVALNQARRYKKEYLAALGEAQVLRAQLDALHPGETVEGVVMERDHYRVQLERESEWVKQYKADRDDALAELAAVKAERSTWRVGHDLANERVAVLESELAAVKAERDEIELRRDAIDKQLLIHRGAYDALDAKLAALRQRESVPVKVRFDVTAAQASKEMREKFDVHCHVAGLQIQMDYLATHAVIDVPAGVPSVNELHDIGEKAYHRAEMGDMNRSRVVAIRDRVLVGVAGGECKECEKNKAELRRHNDKWTGFIQRCQTDAQNARAALEGE